MGKIKSVFQHGLHWSNTERVAPRRLFWREEAKDIQDERMGKLPVSGSAERGVAGPSTERTSTRREITVSQHGPTRPVPDGPQRRDCAGAKRRAGIHLPRRRGVGPRTEGV